METTSLTILSRYRCGVLCTRSNVLSVHPSWLLLVKKRGFSPLCFCITQCFISCREGLFSFSNISVIESNLFLGRKKLHFKEYLF